MMMMEARPTEEKAERRPIVVVVVIGPIAIVDPIATAGELPAVTPAPPRPIHLIDGRGLARSDAEIAGGHRRGSLCRDSRQPQSKRSDCAQYHMTDIHRDVLIAKVSHQPLAENFPTAS